MVITSRINPLIKQISSLHDKKSREEQGLYLVEGIKPVNECIAAGGMINRIICTEKLAENYPGAVIVSESVFGALSSEKTPQGVIATVKIPRFELKPPQNSCLLLDRLQDPGNLGTVIRTANAAGYREIYATGCADPYSPKAVRASMSGIFFTRVYQGGTEEILRALDGIPIVCADMRGEDISRFKPPQKFCICIGSEGSGISGVIAEKAAYKVKIPMTDSCESLNAAVSAGIAMYVLKEFKVR